MWPEEGFEDLFRDNFIMAAGRVSRRKLNRITTGPYQCALLQRGVSKRVDPEDERVPVLQQAMEYAGSVGTMLLDEVAYVNGQTESGMGRAMNRIEREVERVDEAVVEHTTLIAEAQGDIEMLIAEARRKDHEIDRLRELVDELLNCVTALEGRQDNLIEIPDSPVPLPVQIHIDDAHRLVPIEELVPDSEGEEDGGVDLEEVFQVRPGEEYVDGETILDVLRRRNAREEEVPEYVAPPDYNDPGYVSDHGQD